MSRSFSIYSPQGSDPALRMNDGTADTDLPPIIAARTSNNLVTEPKWSWWPFRWTSRRRQALDSYTRLATLLDTLQGHFDRQDHRAAELNNHLEKLAQTIDAAAHEQRNISTQSTEKIAALSEHTAEISSALSELPGAVNSQAALLRALKQQAEAGHEVDVQMLHSIQRLTPTLESVRESGQSNHQLLERYFEQEQATRRQVVETLQSQGRRLFYVTLAISIIALASGLIGLILVLQRVR